MVEGVISANIRPAWLIFVWIAGKFTCTGEGSSILAGCPNKKKKEAAYGGGGEYFCLLWFVSSFYYTVYTYLITFRITKPAFS